MTLNEIDKAISTTLAEAQGYLDDMERYGHLSVEYKLDQDYLPYVHRLTLLHDNMEVVACEYMLDKSFSLDISLKEQLSIEKTVKNYMLDLLSSRNIADMIRDRNESGTFMVYTILESARLGYK